MYKMILDTVRYSIIRCNSMHLHSEIASAYMQSSWTQKNLEQLLVQQAGDSFHSWLLPGGWPSPPKKFQRQRLTVWTQTKLTIQRSSSELPLAICKLAIALRQAGVAPSREKQTEASSRHTPAHGPRWGWGWALSAPWPGCWLGNTAWTRLGLWDCGVALEGWAPAPHGHVSLVPGSQPCSPLLLHSECE